ncbi:hypothetical protein DFH11DRAFT_1548061 [Phellopilus nigrolimitatus]|nr:hypothetical protein DFH11DRAFT_1548061 [Phellopilus nigrolimitatus]
MWTTLRDTALDEAIAANTVEALPPSLWGAWRLDLPGLHSSLGDPRDSGRELNFGSGVFQVYFFNTLAQSDTQLFDREQDTLDPHFHTLSASDPVRVVRTGFGKCGAAIAVHANFFAIKYPQDVVLYDYPAVIAPDVVSTTLLPPRDSARLNLEAGVKKPPFRKLLRDNLTHA